MKTFSFQLQRKVTRQIKLYDEENWMGRECILKIGEKRLTFGNQNCYYAMYDFYRYDEGVDCPDFTSIKSLMADHIPAGFKAWVYDAPLPAYAHKIPQWMENPLIKPRLMYTLATDAEHDVGSGTASFGGKGIGLIIRWPIRLIHLYGQENLQDYKCTIQLDLIDECDRINSHSNLCTINWYLTSRSSCPANEIQSAQLVNVHSSSRLTFLHQNSGSLFSIKTGRPTGVIDIANFQDASDEVPPPGQEFDYYKTKHEADGLTSVAGRVTLITYVLPKPF